MCSKLKGYLDLVKTYEREILMLVGFAGCVFLYLDIREFVVQQTVALENINHDMKELGTRISKVESKLEDNRKD